MKDGLKALRKLRGLSRRELSERTGISERSIERWETFGVENATVKNILPIARELGARIEDLVGE